MIRWVGLFGIPVSDQDAGSGRRIWLAANIDAAESVVDLGGVGTMLCPWHQNVTAFDDLSGFGPGHRILADTFHRGDVCSLPFANEQFDVAVMTEVLEHVPTPVVALREAGRVAKRVLITTPYEQRWKNAAQYHISGHLRFATPEILANQIRAAGLHGDVGLLEFASWSFFVAVVGRDAASQPWDRYAQHGQVDNAAG